MGCSWLSSPLSNLIKKPTYIILRTLWLTTYWGHFTLVTGFHQTTSASHASTTVNSSYRSAHIISPSHGMPLLAQCTKAILGGAHFLLPQSSNSTPAIQGCVPSWSYLSYSLASSTGDGGIYLSSHINHKTKCTCVYLHLFGVPCQCGLWDYVCPLLLYAGGLGQPCMLVPSQ